MVLFKVNNPNSEVSGASVLPFVNAMGPFKSTALGILAKNGIKDPTMAGWYNQQNYLNAYKEMYQKLGDATLRVIGLKIPETAILPPGVNSIEIALEFMDKYYQANHRNTGIGWKYQKTSKDSGISTSLSPYPCSMEGGILEGLLNKFRKSGQFVTVKHTKGSCKLKGQNECSYDVKW